MSAITDYLTYYRDPLHPQGVLHFRNNVGKMFGSHNGKKWCVNFGVKGMADFVAHFTRKGGGKQVLWIEAKAEKGTQTSDQAMFEKLVKAYGEDYLIARSSDDVKAWVAANLAR